MNLDKLPGAETGDSSEQSTDHALLRGEPTFVVTDHFDLTQVGLALVGSEPMDKLGGVGPWSAVVRRPDGALVRSIAYRPRFIYRVRPEVERIALTLPELTKADVPIGSEVFLRPR